MFSITFSTSFQSVWHMSRNLLESGKEHLRPATKSSSGMKTYSGCGGILFVFLQKGIWKVSMGWVLLGAKLYFFKKNNGHLYPPPPIDHLITLQLTTSG